MDLVPKNSLAFNINYSFDWLSSIPGFIRLDYNYQAGFSSINRRAPIVPNEAHSGSINFINLNIEAQWGQLRTTLFGQNLSDEDQLLAPALTAFNSQARPRTFGLKFDYDF